MIAWRPHTEAPTGPEVAVIAIRDKEGGHFLLPEIYRWDVNYQCWMGEANALLIKHRAFQWAPESEILRTLP